MGPGTPSNHLRGPVAPVVRAFCPQVAFVAQFGPPTAANGLECVFEHPKGSKIVFEKTHFWPFLTPFQSQNKPFEGLLGPSSASKRSQKGSKQPPNASLRTPNGLGSFLEKLNFGHFQIQFGARFEAVCGQFEAPFGPQTP